MEYKPVNVSFEDNNLTNVNYVFNPVTQGNSYDVKIEDDITYDIIDERSFYVVYKRKTISNDPFVFEVIFKVRIAINDLKELDANNETLQEFADRKKEEIVSIMTFPARASLVISNITRESGGSFVTIPVIFKNK